MFKHQNHRYATRGNKVSEKVKGKESKKRSALGDITNGKSNSSSAAANTKKAKGIPGKTKKAKSKSTSNPVISETIIPAHVRNVDEHDKRNPQMCTTYVNEIYDYLRTQENRPLYRPSSTYIVRQEDINDKMRAILIDWLVEVHLKFKLKPETLYLTVNILDRYLEKEPVSRKKLQLLGVTALLLASKYEEIYPPEVRDLVYVCDRAYNRDQILSMESKVLNAFKFRFTVATIFPFLARFAKVAGLRERGRYVAHFFAERTLQEYRMLKYSPSIIAAASVYLALRAKHGETSLEVWTPTVVFYTGYSKEEIMECANEIKQICVRGEKSSLKAVMKKYQSSRFCVAFELAARVY